MARVLVDSARISNQRRFIKRENKGVPNIAPLGPAQLPDSVRTIDFRCQGYQSFHCKLSENCTQASRSRPAMGANLKGKTAPIGSAVGLFGMVFLVFHEFIC